MQELSQKVQAKTSFAQLKFSLLYEFSSKFSLFYLKAFGLSKKYIAFMQIDKNNNSYFVGAKRSSLCSLRLFAEDSCSEHKE